MAHAGKNFSALKPSPASAKASLRFRTLRGEVLTDFSEDELVSRFENAGVLGDKLIAAQVKAEVARVKVERNRSLKEQAKAVGERTEDGQRSDAEHQRRRHKAFDEPPSGGGEPAGAPSTVTVPAAITCTPTTARINVVLPLPLGPSSPVTEPRGTVGPLILTILIVAGIVGLFVLTVWATVLD